MKATFIGSNGSMGLSKNKQYEIRAIIDKQYPIAIEIDGYLYCPYGSLEAFFKNWRV